VDVLPLGNAFTSGDGVEHIAFNDGDAAVVVGESACGAKPSDAAAEDDRV
jgi:hypothetical protein